MTNAHINILARLGTALSGDVELSRAETEAVWDAVEALVAEVERLRAEADEMRRWAEEAAHAENLNAQDAQKERAAVVAWLRTRESQIENWPPGGMNEISMTYNIIADDIECGEHRRKEKE